MIVLSYQGSLNMYAWESGESQQDQAEWKEHLAEEKVKSLRHTNGTTDTEIKPGDPDLAAKLRRNIAGEVLVNSFDRGRYSTDASIYQIEPLAAILPRSNEDVEAARAIGQEAGISLLPRGGGTSQGGQTVGQSLVLDFSKHMNAITDFDEAEQTVWVQPGVILDQLNHWLKPKGLFYPVDISTGSRATLGGMAGNNACGARSIRYGIMVDNVLAIDALLADGTIAEFSDVPGNLAGLDRDGRYAELVQSVRSIADRYHHAIDTGFPKVQRRVGGYNLDRIDPAGHNMASILIGSEGTLAIFRRLKLKLQRLPAKKVLGVCHFPSFHDAMLATKTLVELAPSAVELVDRNIIELGRKIPAYRPLIDRFVRGEPDAILLVEFAGDEEEPLHRSLLALDQTMADLGFQEAVLPVTKPEQQTQIWDVRKAGLNIVMSMKGDGKPVSFIEDCAVPLEHLADYTAALTNVFTRHGTTATWYAHASVGTLHVRPILNLKQEKDVKALRAIAEEAMDLVKRYKGSHSGEHGDGLVRSEFHEKMFGSDLVHAFENVKQKFDPGQTLNPGKIVNATKMDDRHLFRFKPDYQPMPIETGLDWSAWGGFSGAAEMCNNNGACRKATGGVMCPSFRITSDERHVTRGRANTLRLALSGQLGPDALTSEDMADSLDLCVSCKACRRECPTGIDMAAMKIEVLHQRQKKFGLTLKDRLIGHLPRYAPYAQRIRRLLHARDSLPGLALLGELGLGISAKRSLPRWHESPFLPETTDVSNAIGNQDVVLFADTFTTWFEPDNARAAERVLSALGYRVLHPKTEGRPLCCGRTYLASGMIEQAREEAMRLLQTLMPFVERGVPIIGLEPSCLLTLKDEIGVLLDHPKIADLAEAAHLFETFLAANLDAKDLTRSFKALPWEQALVHGHCHQKAFAMMGEVSTCLDWIPSLEHEVIESSCCGMAGAFGYNAQHYSASINMAEQSLLPAVRAAGASTVIVADGTSCRHQIKDGSGIEAFHVARLLDLALSST